MLAFALSFDEVIVTTFTTGGNQTLPIYILKLLSRDPSPTVNVIAVVVIILSALPVYLAQRLSSDAGATAGRA
jgi:putative spermidine/putrescine transport system permease protein